MLSVLSLIGCTSTPIGFKHNSLQPYYMDYNDNEYSPFNVSMELYIGLWTDYSFSKERNDHINELIFLNFNLEQKYDGKYSENSILLKEIELKNISKDTYKFEQIERNNAYYITYSSSIFVTIPNQIFVVDDGYFSIAFTSKNVKENTIDHSGTGLLLKYSIKDNIISIKKILH